ncbi:hypothetical protein H632_c3611p0 [Helicosporidium sp. ATCC 50920]|nr:hypothetical protein H632_c3611p0 [Helicosporidium sp. ATCC 50920]|eukprot:KDD72263.1 hypothetical protein H632_c3611p0 [Helicosporidium sp. ATCC 50920]
MVQGGGSFGRSLRHQRGLQSRFSSISAGPGSDASTAYAHAAVAPEAEEGRDKGAGGLAALPRAALSLIAPADPKSSQDWEVHIANAPGTEKVLTAAILLENEHPFLEDDHMFSAFVSKGIVRDLNGYYNADSRQWNSVISLGTEVCGWPKIVHGGLTAAMFDESFGGMLFALKKHNELNFWGPAYTVSLEVRYKARMKAGRKVLCTVEVEKAEGRKLFMKATMSDGPDGIVYATAKGLFISPKPTKLLSDVAGYLLERVRGA